MLGTRCLFICNLWACETFWAVEVFRLKRRTTSTAFLQGASPWWRTLRRWLGLSFHSLSCLSRMASENDSLAKMRAAEQALESKEKAWTKLAWSPVTRSLTYIIINFFYYGAKNHCSSCLESLLRRLIQFEIKSAEREEMQILK
ncbi:hypothetical protein OPV22_007712 [Ensete ventricosum]|uniref:Uncharacterized protein n=1 Tax=Ensete ventricosum TaxID=4639 RepID=A0AAV8RNF1_ENSVE|nr:hypothetical protein OPV22_007712 [Ensete ventricosum]